MISQYLFNFDDIHIISYKYELSLYTSNKKYVLMFDTLGNSFDVKDHIL